MGASLGEAVRVRCRVAADPSDDVAFEWQFNNSGESFGVPPARLGNGTNGVIGGDLSYTPSSERDYGTLACWARNAVGRQLEPCVFQVLPAGKLAVLLSCASYFNVICLIVAFILKLSSKHKNFLNVRTKFVGRYR